MPRGNVAFPEFNYLVVVMGPTGFWSTLGGFQVVNGLTPGTQSSAVTLQRGVVDGSVLNPWMSAMRLNSGSGGRTVLVSLRSESGQTVTSWQLGNATPASFNGPPPSSSQKAAAIQQLVLTVQTIQVVASHAYLNVARASVIRKG